MDLWNPPIYFIKLYFQPDTPACILTWVWISEKESSSSSSSDEDDDDDDDDNDDDDEDEEEDGDEWGKFLLYFEEDHW